MSGGIRISAAIDLTWLERLKVFLGCKKMIVLIDAEDAEAIKLRLGWEGDEPDDYLEIPLEEEVRRDN